MRPWMESMAEVLSTRKARVVLWSIHLLMLLVVLWLPHGAAPDQVTYFRLADGLREGSFSIWNGIIDPAPIDVLRTHGYPAFLAVWRSISDRVELIFVAQGALYLLTLALLVRTLRGGANGQLRQNLFLLLMLPQFQMLHYVCNIFPEMLTGTLCALAVWAFLQPMGVRRAALVGTILAAAFWVRPAMLFFPVFLLLADLFFAPRGERARNLRDGLLATTVFVLLAPLPFTWWNLRSHGVASPVPLSGSAVNSNLGIWQLRLPGYGTMHYFQYSTFGREFIPLVNDQQAAEYFLRYQEQWARIDSVSRLSMTASDSVNLPIMATRKDDLYVTRSPAYTVALNKVISAENRRMMTEEPLYYLCSRLYAAVRLWVTNINLPMKKVVYEPKPGVVPIVGEPVGLKGWLAAIAPFLLTFITFGIGLPLLAWRMIRDPGPWRGRRHLIALILYVWMVHIPMSIQSRYTVPVHALAIACFAFMITDRWVTRRKNAA